MPTNNTAMQWPQRGNRKTEFRTSHGGVEPTRHTAPLRFQQGIAVLGIVAILLSAITFSAISTSQQVQQFYTIEKTKRDTEKAHVKTITEEWNLVMEGKLASLKYWRFYEITST